ncbi:MAG: hypothetical protein ACLVML_01985 [Candidatus Gastranaerophilaceae bacterium]
MILVSSFLCILVVGLIIGYIAYNGFENYLKSLIYLACITCGSAIITLPLIYIIPKGLTFSECWHLKMKVDNESICLTTQKWEKICRWEQVERIECKYSIIWYKRYSIIWYGKQEYVQITEYIKELRQLYKTIYEHVKERSLDAKIDERFVEYIAKYLQT